MESSVIYESSRTALECALRFDCSVKKTVKFKSTVIRSEISSCYPLFSSVLNASRKIILNELVYGRLFHKSLAILSKAAWEPNLRLATASERCFGNVL